MPNKHWRQCSPVFPVRQTTHLAVKTGSQQTHRLAARPNFFSFGKLSLGSVAEIPSNKVAAESQTRPSAARV